MNMPNACIFFGVGFIMEFLRLAPAITGVREMWLLVMGGVLMLTGGVFLGHEAWVWVKPRMVTPMLAWMPRAAQESRQVPEGRRAAV